MNRRNFVEALSLGLLALLFPWFTPKKKLKAKWSAQLAPNEAAGVLGVTEQQLLDTGYVYAPYQEVYWSEAVEEDVITMLKYRYGKNRTRAA